ncbi:MAG TPA: hypothetical protein VNT55_25990 [Baekduia sp.]|nr:hypothetical protein [Baekduia sp.]
MSGIRRQCTFANAVACVCLFVVLGGDSMAKDVTASAAKLVTGKQVKNRSLTAADIKKGSLTGAEVKDRSLTAADFNGSVAGPKGDKGDKGDPGAKGDAGPVGQIQGAAAGGDLTGTFPNPAITTGAVNSAKIADGTITPADLSLPWAFSGTFTDPALSITSTSGSSVSNPLLKSVVNSTTAIRPAVYGEVNSQYANFGTAGVYGVSSGTGGFAGLFYASNPSGNGPAVIALADGNGNGLTANASNTGDGVETTADGTGNALYAWTPNFASGRAARIVNYNTSNTNPVLTAEQHSGGSIALFKAGNPGTVNVARIDATGKGFFNGGTQTGGADLAEVVPTCGSLVAGEVVEIDPRKPDCFRASTTASTTRVAGVVSSAPGMTLNAPHGATAAATGPALALAGRVPVKVTAQGGRSIRIGDLLVASSTPGYAMRAPARPAVGTVIGKALANFDGAKGSIKMLVMTR